MPKLLNQSRALFIRRWGEMGANWGISRAMAEIHALLYISNRPLCTDDVMAELQISRGSASINLRELVNWGLIHRTHLPGDRKQYFRCPTAVWQMFETIMRERRRREVQPIVETIDRCCAMVRSELGKLRSKERGDAVAFVNRLEEMQEFLELMNTLFNTVTTVGHRGVAELVMALGRWARQGRSDRPSAE